jgi:phosphocarrier protein HPr
MSGGDPIRIRLRIQNRLGLHARAAALFVQAVTPFAAEVSVEKDGITVSGKSIMGLMTLAAGKGSEIAVEATGPDAGACVQAIRELVDARFREAD